MTKLEYENLQLVLSALLDEGRLYRKRLSGREKDGYEMGVRACKSAISAFNPNRKDKRGEAHE